MTDLPKPGSEAGYEFCRKCGQTRSCYHDVTDGQWEIRCRPHGHVVKRMGTEKALTSAAKTVYPPKRQ